MKKIDKTMTKEERRNILDSIVHDITEISVFKKYMLDYLTMSGCSTIVSPIIVGASTIQINLKPSARKNYFRSAMSLLANYYPNELESYQYCKGDGSCPQRICFYLKPNLMI